MIHTVCTDDIKIKATVFNNQWTNATALFIHFISVVV